MAGKQGGGKKKRTAKRSAGERRSSNPVSLTRLQQYLLGKGPTKAFERKVYRDSLKQKVGR